MQTRTMMKIWVIAALIMAITMSAACSGGSSSPAPAATAVPSTTAPTDAPAAAPTAAPAIDAAALLQARCTDCHGLNKVTTARYTQEQWKQVVTNMVKKGATLTADEQAILIAYLAETYKP